MEDVFGRGEAKGEGREEGKEGTVQEVGNEREKGMKEGIITS